MSFFDKVGKALHKFGKENLGPALGEAGKALDEFGKEKLGPAMGEAGKALDHFSQHQLGLALAVTVIALDQFGKEKLGLAAKEDGRVPGWDRLNNRKYTPTVRTKSCFWTGDVDVWIRVRASSFHSPLFFFSLF